MIRELGNLKFIITFETQEDHDVAIKEYSNLLLAHFDSIMPWSQYDRAEERNVWLSIYGIPPQVWPADNIKMGSSMGKLYLCRP